jgi:hypothetical protein
MGDGGIAQFGAEYSSMIEMPIWVTERASVLESEHIIYVFDSLHSWEGWLSQ